MVSESIREDPIYMLVYMHTQTYTHTMKQNAAAVLALLNLQL